MKRSRSRAPSQRQLRVGEELRHVLSEIISRGGLSDPALSNANLTVTEVRLSPDLRNATVFVIPLGGAELENKVEALNRAASYFRGQIARVVDLRNNPRLTFAADRSFDEANKIDAILSQPSVRRDLTEQPDFEDAAQDQGDEDHGA
ncbi:30S ribosome-binding factor RbfA [Pelagibius sp. Alg239-R121]|uniref:30S ribosome-binding factor RbfA n=1 Tax=Pelagibius sp. Alg239-R121 TaxID=2993448 RepID=UPI0024A62A56|nr:30S ribosome-binding factor RbfA [Pelagibius sp. Alg239-R121]